MVLLYSARLSRRMVTRPGLRGPVQSAFRTMSNQRFHKSISGADGLFAPSGGISPEPQVVGHLLPQGSILHDIGVGLVDLERDAALALGGRMTADAVFVHERGNVALVGWRVDWFAVALRLLGRRGNKVGAGRLLLGGLLLFGRVFRRRRERGWSQRATSRAASLRVVAAIRQTRGSRAIFHHDRLGRGAHPCLLLGERGASATGGSGASRERERPEVLSAASRERQRPEDTSSSGISAYSGR